MSERYFRVVENSKFQKNVKFIDAALLIIFVEI